MSESGHFSLSKKVKRSQTVFGQVVVGPPGAGKTTYCAKALNLYKDKLNRNVAIVNLDPANDNMSYTPVIDVMDLIKVADVMDDLKLGPNGALVYCMEYLEENFDWLLSRLNELSDYYLIFDMAGQIELYTHHSSIKNIMRKLESLDYHLCAVHLIDWHYCSDPAKLMATLLMSLTVMMNLGLPHLNVLTKADLMKKNADKLDFNIDFYTDVLNLDYLLELLNERSFTNQFKELNAAIAELVENYSLISFISLDSNSERSLLNLKNAIDKANGYIYGSGEERNMQSLLSCAVGARTETERYDADFL